jgi:glucose/arabinose dehydrogenase
MYKKYLLYPVFILVLFFVTVILPSCKPEPVQEEVAAGEEEVTGGEVVEEEEAAKEEEEVINDSELIFPVTDEVENRFMLQDAFQGITFTRPLDLQNAGDSSGRLFIVEQSGRISIIDPSSLETSAVLFLDISDRVDDSSNEMGLLGLAFHPDFENNGSFFVNYTDGNNTVISRFTLSSDNPDSADAASEEILLTFQQPYPNHNGGQLVFGPDDGYLYIATGDGGSGGDPHGNGQNLGTLLGKILRIDVDSQDPGLNYTIPHDNPFTGNTEDYREEIYAYGLRNPWRFSFDSPTNRMWTADVGQDTMEEIDIIEKGGNYGWNIMEGSLCYNPRSGCDSAGLELPIYEYEHSLGESITGGYVYRGENLPLLKGAYIYADYISGTIWGIWYEEGTDISNFTLSETGLNISSFGIDENNELYLTAFDGKIYRLVPLS